MDRHDILFVDDERNALQAFERQFRKQYALRTAGSGDEALAIMKDSGPFAVVVSDLKMPGMNGIQLLAQIRMLYPESVRIILTGHADLDAAMEAVNSGEIFRFLTKPISPVVLAVSMNQAIKQHQLIVAEKDLLDQTLKGSVKVLCEVLGYSNPSAFSSGQRIREHVVTIARELNLDRLWQYEIAALISQIGCIAIPRDILLKVQSNSKLTPKEDKIYRNHPKVGGKLIGNIPRMEDIAAMVEHQMFPWRALEEHPAPVLTSGGQMGAQILKAAIDHDRYLQQGMTHQEAIAKMAACQGEYHPQILRILEDCRVAPQQTKIVNLNFDDLVPGMIAEEDILAQNGSLIIPRGQEITWPMIMGLMNYIEHMGVREPIRIRRDT